MWWEWMADTDVYTQIAREHESHTTWVVYSTNNAHGRLSERRAFESSSVAEYSTVLVWTAQGLGFEFWFSRPYYRINFLGGHGTCNLACWKCRWTATKATVKHYKLLCASGVNLYLDLEALYHKNQWMNLTLVKSLMQHLSLMMMLAVPGNWLSLSTVLWCLKL